MRVIAGVAGGRRLVGPKGSVTRPPTDRMREALFASLGDSVPGAHVLDLYAGAGTFGLEALSRGAVGATFVERDRRALAALRHNIAAVDLGGTVLPIDVNRAFERLSGEFDVVFVDPPYALGADDLEPILAAVASRLSSGGVVLVHRRRDGIEVPTRGTLVSSRNRRYGDARVWWYEKEER